MATIQTTHPKRSTEALTPEEVALTRTETATMENCSFRVPRFFTTLLQQCAVEQQTTVSHIGRLALFLFFKSQGLVPPSGA